MTKRVWGLTDRRPCGLADREDKRTIKNVWVMRKMSQEKQMTKRAWGLTDRRPCGSADRENKRTIKKVWVMGKMTKKTIEIVTNRTGTTGTDVGCEKNHYQDNREQERTIRG